MKILRLCIALLTCMVGMAQEEQGRIQLSAVDGGERPLEMLEIGSSLHIAVSGLNPYQLYEIRMGVDKDPSESLDLAVSFARVTANAWGQVPNFILWFQSGVIGCSARSETEYAQPYRFRSFDEAEETLAGRTLRMSIHQVDEGEGGGRGKVSATTVSQALAGLSLPMLARQSSIAYVSDADACLLNSQENQSGDVYVSGRNFTPGEQLRVSIVSNQRRWYVGDTVNDITGAGSANAPELVTVDGSGRFTIHAWDAASQVLGAYDVVVQRARPGGWDQQILSQDTISYSLDTAFMLNMYYPIGGPLMDIAGRPFSGYPYFEFSDSFDPTEDVWGAVDPTYVQASHPGGNYAAYYVVDHRDVPGWDPGLGGATNLIDVSGGVEIYPVKSSCINGTDTIIWHAPLVTGDYDVVVDFGASPTSFVHDYTYNYAVDFLDGASQIGFVVADDPYNNGSYAIGEFEYSYDDYFSSIGGANDVDLRAVVRYPATTNGIGTPVVPGQHPIFVMEHGNHGFCEVSGYNHATCPNRTPNHKGYMQLLETLASHGIIAVSIDAYDMTGWVPGWITERGQLILKHLELWSHMDDTATYTGYPDPGSGLFASKVDMNAISISGHSRGGEASVSAYVQNTAFNIGSVSSIAPVDFNNYTLGDVPYFVILPAADGDVSNLAGIQIYDRAGNTVSDNTNKSGLYAYGANHNFFNTVWADDGDDSPSGRQDFIAKATQQKLGEAYLSAFTRLHLNGETVYADMLRGNLSFPSTAGLKLYHMHHEKSHQKHESGAATAPSPSGLTKSSVSGPSQHSTQAMKVNWTAFGGTLTYTVPVAQRDVTGYEVLAFRVAQTNSALNPASGNQNVYVELVGGGNTKGTYATKYDDIPQPYPHPYGYFYNIMTTVRIPLHSFIINNSGVTLDDIDTIRFKFNYPSQGEIYVDDIEFSR